MPLFPCPSTINCPPKDRVFTALNNTSSSISCFPCHRMDMPGTLSNHTQDLGPLISFSEQELRNERLQHEILRLLISRRPNTLHIRQRHQACVDRRGHGASIAQRYSDCRAVLDAVVLDLGVIAEKSPAAKKRLQKPSLEQVTEEILLVEQGRWNMRNRSSTERRMWLGDVEERIEREGRFRASRQNDGQIDERRSAKARRTSNPAKLQGKARMNGRSEPFQERQVANKRQGTHQEGVEYAAANDLLLHPGISPMPSRSSLDDVLFPCLDPKARGEDSDGTSCKPRRLVRSMRAITTSGIDRSSSRVGYLGSRKRFFMCSIASRKGKEAASRSNVKRRKSDEEITSLLTDRKTSSSFESSRVQFPKASKATTSGLPAEVTAGSFSANNGQVTQKEKRSKDKHWWERVRRLGRALLEQDERERKGQTNVYGCAPGPSTRTAALDDPLHPEHSFCMNCMPLRQEGDWGNSLPSKSVLHERRVSAKKSERITKHVPTAQIPDLSELALPQSTKDKTLLLSRSLPNDLLAPPRKYDSFPPARNHRSHSSLPRTPEYGVVEPLINQLQGVVNTCATPSSIVASDEAKITPHKPNNVSVDEEAIWAQCSERLDHVSDVAATDAWANIRKQRDAMSSQGLNNTNNVGPETPGGSPRTNSINTEIAEVVQIKRVRNQDVNITGISPRRQVPLQNNVLSRGKSLGANDSYDTVNGTPQALKTPWESVWHRDLPVGVKVKREQTPGGHSVADTAMYSLSDAASEEEQGDTTTAKYERNVPLSTSSSSRKDTIERESLLSHPPKFQERGKATQTKIEDLSSSSSKEVPSMASFLSPFPLPFRQPTPTWLRSPST